jgi:hypothetical protein
MTEQNNMLPFLRETFRYLGQSWPHWTEAFQAFLSNQEDPTGLRIYNLRMMALSLERELRLTNNLLGKLDTGYFHPSDVGRGLDDFLLFLEPFGLTIAPHSDPSYGWGYRWQNRDWAGPYPTPMDAVREAFSDAIRAIDARSSAPFPAHNGYMVRWNEPLQDWEHVKFEDGQLWCFTGNPENNGWEIAQEAKKRQLHPSDDECERAHLAVKILSAVLEVRHCRLDPVNWQQEGLQARVSLNGQDVGDVLTVYNRYREDSHSFFRWLTSQLTPDAVSPKKRSMFSQKPLTAEETDQLREAIRGHRLEAIITLALLTGLRREELLHLTWQDVDLEKGELHFQDAKTTERGLLPISPDGVVILQHHLTQQKETEQTWTDQHLVFPNEQHQLLKEFHTILEQAGLPHISFHRLRAYTKKKAFALSQEAQG